MMTPIDTGNWKIKQLLSAVDWFAVYESGDEQWSERLSCWALVEDGKEEFVVGLVPNVDTTGLADFAVGGDFSHYRHADDEDEATPQDSA